MSIINDDKKTARDGRTERLQNVEVNLRDQIPKKLLAKVRDLKFGEKVTKMWGTADSNRANWLERQQIYLTDWDEFLISSSEGPFAGASNLHLPMPFIVAKTYHARMLQAIMSTDVPVKALDTFPGPASDGYFFRVRIVRFLVNGSVMVSADDGRRQPTRFGFCRQAGFTAQAIPEARSKPVTDPAAAGNVDVGFSANLEQ